MEGDTNTVCGTNVHVEGDNNDAKGTGTHVEGSRNVVRTEDKDSIYLHMEGGSNTTSGQTSFSHIEGKNNKVSGDANHVEGSGNTLTGANGHVSGVGNVVDSDQYYPKFVIGNNANDVAEAVFIVGCGHWGTSNTRNVLTVKRSGDILFEKDGKEVKLQDVIDNLNNTINNSGNLVQYPNGTYGRNIEGASKILVYTGSIENEGFKDNSTLEEFVADVSQNTVTGLMDLFKECRNLKKVIFNANIGNMSTLNSTFKSCTSLTTLDLSDMKAESLERLMSTFMGCWSLTNIKFPKCKKITFANDAFSGCTSLATIKLDSTTVISTSISFSDSPLTHDSALAIINALDADNPGTLTLNSAVKDALTDEDKAIITNKGWTLA